MTAKIQIEAETMFDAARKDIDKLDQSVKELEQTTAKAGTGFKVAGLSLTDLQSGINLVQRAVGMLGDVFDKTIGDTLRYNEQIRDLARLSGAGTDETSRLVQVADDLKVEFGTLTLAAKTLAQNGIALTTEALAKASDEYLALSDAGARAEYAVKKFGRSGLELTKILEAGGDELRKMAAAQNESLIATEEQVKAARQLEKNLDELEDTAKGVSLAIGNFWIPILNDAYKATKLLTTGTQDLDAILKTHIKDIEKTSDSYHDYVYEAVRAYGASKGFGSGVGFADIQVNLGEESLVRYAIAVGAVDKKQWEAAKSTKEVANQYSVATNDVDEFRLGMIALDVETRNAKIEQDKLTQATKDMYAAQLKTLNESMRPLTAEFLFQKAAVGLDSDAANELAFAMGLIDQKTYDAMTAVKNLRASADADGNGIITAAEEMAAGYNTAILDIINGTSDAEIALRNLTTAQWEIKVKADFSDLEKALKMAETLQRMGTAGIVGPTLGLGGQPVPQPAPTTPPNNETNETINGMK